MDINIDEEEQQEHPREWDDEGGRRVRQRNVPRSASFRERVPIDREHIILKRSISAGVQHSARLNQHAPFMSLHSLIQDGPQNQGFIVAMIMSINTESPMNKLKFKRGITVTTEDKVHL